MPADRLKIEGRFPLSPACWTGIGSLALAALLFPVHWPLSVLPLAFYLVLCCIAPFMTRFGFFMPVISRGRSGLPAVALTFDDGPDPWVTPALLQLLKAHKSTATFFVSGKMAARYPSLVIKIAAQGHTVGNHSYNHDPLAAFKRADAIRREVESTQQVLESLGIFTCVYRPPLGFTSPGLARPLSESGLTVVNFSCRAFDRGNRRIEGMASNILKRVRADDILLLHDIMPKGKAFLKPWLAEMEALLAGLDSRGLSVIPLGALIGIPIMAPSIRNNSPMGNMRGAAGSD